MSGFVKSGCQAEGQTPDSHKKTKSDKASRVKSL